MHSPTSKMIQYVVSGSRKPLKLRTYQANVAHDKVRGFCRDSCEGIVRDRKEREGFMRQGPIRQRLQDAGSGGVRSSYALRCVQSGEESRLQKQETCIMTVSQK